MTRLTSKQVSGIKIARRNGEILSREHPEIVDLYVGGMTLPELAIRYVHFTDYNLSKSVGINSVRWGLLELMDEKEVTEIARKHKRDNCKKIGKLTGPTNGIHARDEGKGIFEQTNEERIDNGRKAALANGLVPFDRMKLELPHGYVDEMESAILLRDKNMTWKEITNRISKYWGHNRSWKSVQNSYHKIRNRIK